MKKFFVFALVLFLLVPCAYAWEFKLNGSYTWEINYLSRVGPGDLFGNAERAQTIQGTTSGLTTIGLSGPFNGTVVPERFSSKGSDGSWTQEEFVLNPEIKVNPAIKFNSILAFQGNLNGPYVGGPNWANTPHVAGWYLTGSRSESLYDPIATFFMRGAWVTMEIPWGKLEIGRRPFGFGTGWSGADSRYVTIDSVSLSAPYGPLAFGIGVIPNDTGEQTHPYDSRNVDLMARTIASSSDRNEMRKWNVIASVVYGNGPLEIGTMTRFIRYNRVHAFPSPGMTLRDDITGSFASLFLQAFRQDSSGGGTGTSNIPIYGDVTLLTQPIYFKYWNGRFFLNGELDIQYIQATRDGGRTISGRPRAWFLEGGSVCGPLKGSLIYVYKSGHDRSGGIFDVVSSTGGTSGQTNQVADTWNQFIPIGASASALEPYNWLIGYYGTGNNGYDASGYPTYVDFTGAGARLDYALASNLNFWFSYLYARRASNTGSWWGQYTGGIIPTPLRGQNVPDTNLGQEFDFGLSWKLLQNLTMETTFAYWKPGSWFKHAYVDWSSISFTNTDFETVRINPDRAIDPLCGLKLSIKIDF